MSRSVLTSYDPAVESSKNVNVLPCVTEGRMRLSFDYVLLFTLLTFLNVSNIAEQLIDRGLASVVRHRRDDEDRSPDYDKLIAAEHS